LVANRKVIVSVSQLLVSLIEYSGVIKKVSREKVAVFTCPLDVAQTETKGTVLLKNAEEMLNFTTGEENHLEMVCHLLGRYI
jgi:chaperonin GroEL (HSP60 family)